ncbi:membrane protein [Candidatus Nasuia deltocephalinicola]|nr:membrane protein [Candidatus Nasuia deltocephalinicola]
MILNIIKPWEFSIIIIIIYIICIYKTLFLIRKNKFKLILIINIIYITIHTKIDFFSQHIIYINKIQELMIIHIIPTIINKFLKINKNIINKIIFIYNINEYINYIIIIINQLNIISIISFYIMINNNLYKFKNIINLTLFIIYWIININNKIYFNKIKYKLLITIKIIIKIIMGSYIYFNNKDIYTIYKICGEINFYKYIKNQQISGLIEWLINSMMLFLNIIIFKN